LKNFDQPLLNKAVKVLEKDFEEFITPEFMDYVKTSIADDTLRFMPESKDIKSDFFEDNEISEP
jgi:hypothetical protein